MGYSIYEWFDDNVREKLIKLSEELKKEKEDEVIDSKIDSIVEWNKDRKFGYDFFIDCMKDIFSNKDSFTGREDEAKRDLMNIIIDPYSELSLQEKIKIVFNMFSGTENFEILKLTYKEGTSKINVDFDKLFDE